MLKKATKRVGATKGACYLTRGADRFDKQGMKKARRLLDRAIIEEAQDENDTWVEEKEENVYFAIFELQRSLSREFILGIRLGCDHDLIFVDLKSLKRWIKSQYPFATIEHNYVVEEINKPIYNFYEIDTPFEVLYGG